MSNLASHHWHRDSPRRHRAPRPQATRQDGLQTFRHVPSPCEIKQAEQRYRRRQQANELLSEIIGGLLVTAAIAAVVWHLLPIMRS